VHHVLHHWRIRPGSHLYRWKRRHALHHYARRPCNFGVTAQFWDRVFGTAHPGR
jgi:sterol desaturase/sphingolipid hydroxylase (fatty acid hydroxylase superfamily)